MKIAWLYYGDHLNHPFIRIGIQSLVKKGYDVIVHDISVGKAKTDYRHFCIPVDLSAVGLKSAVNKLLYLCLLIFSSISLIIERPNVIIVTMPHMAPVAMVVKFILGSRIVYYPFEVFGEQTGSVNILWKLLERYFLHSVIDSLITQNDKRVEIYRDERLSCVEPVVVHNYKPAISFARESGRLKALFGLRENEMIVLYEGLLVHGRWLDKLMHSARYLSGGTILVLMGETTAWWEKEGKHLLWDPELTGRIKIAPFVPHEKLLECVAGAHAGIIIYDDSTRNNYFCEPGKLSDYVRAGVPVIAPDFPTIGPLVRQYKIGCTFSSPNPEKIAEAINMVVATPKSEWAAGLQKAACELVWETQENIFMKAVIGSG